MNIHRPTGNIYPILPRIFKKPGGGTITNFHKLSDAERIARFEFYPVIDNTVAAEWYQVEGEPVFTYTTTEAVMTKPLTDKSVDDCRQTVIDAVYRWSQRMIALQEVGYAQSEIATWPAMRADIRNYNLNAVVGSAMQEVIDRGIHTAQSLATLLTPKVAIYDLALVERETKVAAVRNPDVTMDELKIIYQEVTG